MASMLLSLIADETISSLHYWWVSK